MSTDNCCATLNTLTYANGSVVDIGGFNMGALRVVQNFSPMDELRIELGGSALYGGVWDKPMTASWVSAKSMRCTAVSSGSVFMCSCKPRITIMPWVRGKPGMAYYGGVYKPNSDQGDELHHQCQIQLARKPWPYPRFGFYNDYTWVTDKPQSAPDSSDNALGMG